MFQPPTRDQSPSNGLAYMLRAGLVATRRQRFAKRGRFPNYSIPRGRERFEQTRATSSAGRVAQYKNFVLRCPAFEASRRRNTSVSQTR